MMIMIYFASQIKPLFFIKKKFINTSMKILIYKLMTEKEKKLQYLEGWTLSSWLFS